MTNDKYLITLGQSGALGSATLKRLLKTFGTCKNIWQAKVDDFKNIKASQELIDKIMDIKKHNNPDEVLNLIIKNDLKIITLFDDSYPQLLKQIANPPLVIYARGNISCLNVEPKISIVGTRRQTFYGQTILANFLDKWSGCLKATVSGLAYGIDSTVHHHSIKNHIATIAVVASGLDWQSFQPSGQKWLAEKIINNNGCLLSNFSINSPVLKHNFPQRNRLIAGLCKATIVIEAGEKSGALITAQHALDYNREVYAVPGDISREQSRGCNQLIAAGANSLLDWQDIYKIFNISSNSNYLENKIFSPHQHLIINCLKTNANLAIDELIEQTNISQSQLIAELSKLEIDEIIKRDLFGNFYLTNKL